METARNARTNNVPPPVRNEEMNIDDNQIQNQEREITLE